MLYITSPMDQFEFRSLLSLDVPILKRQSLENLIFVFVPHPWFDFLVRRTLERLLGLLSHTFESLFLIFLNIFEYFLIFYIFLDYLLLVEPPKLDILFILINYLFL